MFFLFVTLSLSLSGGRRSGSPWIAESANGVGVSLLQQEGFARQETLAREEFKFKLPPLAGGFRSSPLSSPFLSSLSPAPHPLAHPPQLYSDTERSWHVPEKHSLETDIQVMRAASRA